MAEEGDTMTFHKWKKKKTLCIDTEAFASGRTVSDGVSSNGYLAKEFLSALVHESV